MGAVSFLLRPRLYLALLRLGTIALGFLTFSGERIPGLGMSIDAPSTDEAVERAKKLVQRAGDRTPLYRSGMAPDLFVR
ncbi:MAG: hypothetical protein BGO01_01500 [Armatimonadetes bacterium 55-13]|nr:MAG: hypothetical protein BGO01_01500 [Armatimonadetes bacterium 55-13]